MKHKSDITPIITQLVGILNKGKINYSFKFGRRTYIKYEITDKGGNLSAFIPKPHNWFLNRKLKKEISRLKCEVDGVHKWILITGSYINPTMRCKHCRKRK